MFNKINIMEFNHQDMTINHHRVSKRYFKAELGREDYPQSIKDLYFKDTVYLAKSVRFEPKKGRFSSLKKKNMIVDWGDLHVTYSPMFLFVFRQLYDELQTKMSELEKENLKLKHWQVLTEITTAKDIVETDEHVLRSVLGLLEDNDSLESNPHLSGEKGENGK